MGERVVTGPASDARLASPHLTSLPRSRWRPGPSSGAANDESAAAVSYSTITWCDLTFQISSAYWRIVLSEEKRPTLAMFFRAIRLQCVRSA